MKILFCSIKAKRLIEKELAKLENAERKPHAMIPVMEGLIPLLGEPFRIEVKKYARKILILDTDKFSFKLDNPST